MCEIMQCILDVSLCISFTEFDFTNSKNAHNSHRNVPCLKEFRTLTGPSSILEAQEEVRQSIRQSNLADQLPHGPDVPSSWTSKRPAHEREEEQQKKWIHYKIIIQLISKFSSHLTDSS